MLEREKSEFGKNSVRKLGSANAVPPVLTMPPKSEKKHKAPHRGGKRPLAEVVVIDDEEMPSSKRRAVVAASDPSLKIPEEEEEQPVAVPVTQNEPEPPVVADDEVAMDVSEEIKAPVVKAARPKRTTAATYRAPRLKVKAPPSMSIPKVYLFDNPATPKVIIEWVLNWFERADMAVLRAVCRRWKEIIGLRILRQDTTMDGCKSRLRMPESHALGTIDLVWKNSDLAKDITVLSLCSFSAEPKRADPIYLRGAPDLSPFENIHTLSIRDCPRLLDNLALLKNLDVLTLSANYAAPHISPLPTPSSPTTFNVSRLQLLHWRLVRKAQLELFLSMFPRLRHLLFDCGLTEPKSISHWIASTLGGQLETLSIDLLADTNAVNAELIYITDVAHLVNMPSLRILSMIVADVADNDDRATLDEREGETSYSSKTLENLCLLGHGDVRSRIKLDMPNLSELTIAKIFYADVRNCPLIETLQLEIPFFFVSDFFKAYKGDFLRDVSLLEHSTTVKSNRPVDLNLSLPELEKLRVSSNNENFVDFKLDAPKLSDLNFSCINNIATLRITAPLLTTINAEGHPSVLEKLDFAMASFPLLRSCRLHEHHTPLNPHQHRATADKTLVLPSTHTALTEFYLEYSIRDLRTVSFFENLTNLRVVAPFLAKELQDFFYNAPTGLPKLLFADIVCSQSNGNEEWRNPHLAFSINFPDIYHLALTLPAIPEIAFAPMKRIQLLSLVRRQTDFYFSKQCGVHKITYLKNMPSLETLTLNDVKLQTTTKFAHPTLRTLLLQRIQTQQGSKFTFDLPQLRKLEYKAKAPPLWLGGNMPRLEKIVLNRETEASVTSFMQRTNPGHKFERVVENEAPLRAAALPGLAGGGQEYLMRLLMLGRLFGGMGGGFFGNHFIDSDSEDSDDDGYGFAFPQQHHHWYESPTDSDESDSDSDDEGEEPLMIPDDDDSDDEPRRRCPNCGGYH